MNNISFKYCAYERYIVGSLGYSQADYNISMGWKIRFLDQVKQIHEQAFYYWTQRLQTLHYVKSLPR